MASNLDFPAASARALGDPQLRNNFRRAMAGLMAKRAAAPIATAAPSSASATPSTPGPSRRSVSTDDTPPARGARQSSARQYEAMAM